MQKAASSRGISSSGRCTSSAKRRVGSTKARYPGYLAEPCSPAPSRRRPRTSRRHHGRPGQVVTYGELDAEANRLCQLFRSLGLRPGDHVAFCMENHPRFLAIAWGAHYAGLDYTAASARLTTDELAYIVNDCGAQVFITSAYKADQAAEIVADTPGVSSG